MCHQLESVGEQRLHHRDELFEGRIALALGDDVPSILSTQSGPPTMI